MKLLFKQRFFSWFDSYDIYNEAGETVYTVKGQISWGHCLKIFDTNGNEIGTVKEKVITLLPKFEIYLGEQYIGCWVIAKQVCRLDSSEVKIRYNRIPRRWICITGF